MGYLSEKDLKQFDTYHHSSQKTTFELFMINKVLNRIEKCIPEVSSHIILHSKVIAPNTITLMGQIPNILVAIILWKHSLTMNETVPDQLILWGGIIFYWFSICDILDGMRARRQGTGSPLGRIMDEGKYLANR